MQEEAKRLIKMDKDNKGDATNDSSGSQTEKESDK